MDKKAPVKEPSEDVTRESIIAISYTSPDLISEKLPKNIVGEEVLEPHIRDRDEKYRSKLISLSSLSPLDVKVPPGLPGQPNA